MICNENCNDTYQEIQEIHLCAGIGDGRDACEVFRNIPDQYFPGYFLSILGEFSSRAVLICLNERNSNTKVSGLWKPLCRMKKKATIRRTVALYI